MYVPVLNENLVVCKLSIIPCVRFAITIIHLERTDRDNRNRHRVGQVSHTHTHKHTHS